VNGHNSSCWHAILSVGLYENSSAVTDVHSGDMKMLVLPSA
jgi:hypothetical protein